MGAKSMIEAILLSVGVAAALLCCLGILIVPGVYDRLHYLSALSTVPAILIVVAVTIEAGLSADAVKALIAGAILVLTGPVVTHAIARSARIRERGGLSVREEPR
jgi:monovalent cation/proton antiporter MnhG/PhaG subunit